MNLIDLLEKHKDDLISEAKNLLDCAHLKHYMNSDAEENYTRLQKLFDLTLNSVKAKSLTSLIAYSEKIAKERYDAGFEFFEVHQAFNTLETVIWKKINSEIEPKELGEALGLISTVLGAGKEALASKYITLASKVKAPSLDLSYLFTR